MNIRNRKIIDAVIEKADGVCRLLFDGKSEFDE